LHDVLRVKNAEIQNTPDPVAEIIIQRYFEVVNDDQLMMIILKKEEDQKITVSISVSLNE
jgi:hypothetical protein